MFFLLTSAAHVGCACVCVCVCGGGEVGGGHVQPYCFAKLR